MNTENITTRLVAVKPNSNKQSNFRKIKALWITGDISKSSDYLDFLINRINMTLHLFDLVKITNFSHYEEVIFNLKLIRSDLENIITTMDKYKVNEIEFVYKGIDDKFHDIIDNICRKLNKKVEIFYWFINHSYYKNKNNQLRCEIIDLYTNIVKYNEKDIEDDKEEEQQQNNNQSENISNE